MLCDKFLGFANDNHFGAAEHGEAAQFIQHVGQLRGRAFEIDSLRIRREFVHQRGQSLQLEKRVAARQRDRRWICEFIFGHAWESFYPLFELEKSYTSHLSGSPEGAGLMQVGRKLQPQIINMANPYSSFCEDFYVNMRLGSQLSLPHQRETLLHFF